MKMKAFFFTLSLNGFRYKIFVDQPCEIFELLEFLDYKKELIIIEHNGEIYNNFEAVNKYLKKNDTIEIITIVGGG
uniref:hypothetical protein n=1 Tax=Scytothamnus australis TaxID=66621 RepID=UPI002E771D28|nr:hypothetical protein V2495_pgp006 [Scytothamnus australis]WAM64803.1 hypothetical protein [Scytothamnus australis]